MSKDAEGFHLSYHTDENGVLVVTDGQGRKLLGVRSADLSTSFDDVTRLSIVAIPRVNGKSVVNRGSVNLTISPVEATIFDGEKMRELGDKIKSSSDV